MNGNGMRRYAWLVVALMLLALWAWQQHAHAPLSGDAGPASPHSSTPSAGARDTAAHWPAFLPSQALDTLALIERGGPFEHRQDGAVFQNRERLLPQQPRGYYHEYTVETPGSRDRGARRIISGGGIPGQSPPLEYFYSDDHYRSFRRFAPATTTSSP